MEHLHINDGVKQGKREEKTRTVTLESSEGDREKMREDQDENVQLGSTAASLWLVSLEDKMPV